MKFYLKPVKKYGMEQWLAFAVTQTGEVTWRVIRWSERSARAEALRQAAKYRQLNQAFKGV